MNRKVSRTLSTPDIPSQDKSPKSVSYSVWSVVSRPLSAVLYRPSAAAAAVISVRPSTCTARPTYTRQPRRIGFEGMCQFTQSFFENESKTRKITLEECFIVNSSKIYESSSSHCLKFPGLHRYNNHSHFPITFRPGTGVPRNVWSIFSTTLYTAASSPLTN